MEPIPPFNSAVDQLREFLLRAGLRSEPLWVFREDVSFSRGQYWLRYPVPASNAYLAQQLFDRGRARGFGVRINADLLAGDEPCCALQIPTPAEEAADQWASGFVVSVADPIQQAHLVNSGAAWACRRFLNRFAPYRAEIEARFPARIEAAA